jgi:cytochrome c556
MVGVLGFVVGCNREKAKGTDPPKTATKDQPQILEKVDLAPGKSITPQDQARLSSIAMKALVHISRAQQEIEAKNVDAAKKDVAQAETLMAILKEVLPTVKIIDHIQVAKTNLSYLDTTEVRQDLVTIMASLDQLYDVLPEGKAKGHAKQAKEALTKEKEKGAAQAKEALEAVEESLDFREVDLSVSHVSRWVTLAGEYLGKGETKEAGEALAVAVDGVMFIDFDVVDPASVAAREIWLATQDWAAKNPKAAKARIEKAKAALREVVSSGSMSQQDQAKHLIGMIDAIDFVKEADQTGKALQELWQGAKKLDTNEPVLKKK